MKKYFFILVVMALIACKKTIYIGGYAIDVKSKDSIEGIEMGLFAPKQGYSYEDPKWSDLELIASATTNSEGFFSMEIDKKTDVNQMFYFPLPPTDTLSVNAQYSAGDGQNLYKVDYGSINKFELGRSSSVLIKLINFTQEEIKIQYADAATFVYNITYSVFLEYNKPFTGQQYKFEFFSMDGVYLGSTSRYLKTQLPEDGDKVYWFMPLQVIEIDYNTLER